MLRALIGLAARTWFRLVRPMTLGVRVAVFDAEGRVMLVRHSYMPGWYLPGGGIERGETALEAAVKEVREEAGLAVLPEDLRLASIHANFVNFPGDHVLLYACNRFTPSDHVPNPREIAQWGFFPPDALPDGTSPGTRQRLRELAGEASPSPHWVTPVEQIKEQGG
jgi:8-oxo-dGTP pyrophosphatase MutT (NUDIX family)